MSVVNENIVDFIKHQLPGFVLNDAPKLKDFLEKYYEWLESYKVETDTIIPYFSKTAVSFTISLTDISKKFQGGVLGSFDDAEVVEGSNSGATGVLVKKDGTKYYVVETTGTFSENELITGATSGHTGTISNISSYNISITGGTTATVGEILADYVNASGNRSFFVKETTTDATTQSPRGFKTDEVLSFSAEPYLGYTPKVSQYTPQPISAIKNIQNLSDVDKALDDFVDYYMIELLEAFPRNIDADTKRIMIKGAKQFYQTKGTEDSFRYLFRTVFGNEELEFYYPKDDILRSSDGKWSISKKMYLKPFSVTIPDAETRIIYGTTSGASAGIERLTQIRMGDLDMYEIILNNDSVVGEFLRNEEIYYMDGTTKVIVGYPYGLLTKADVINEEQGFTVESDYYIDSAGNIVNYNDVAAADQPFLARLHICSDGITHGHISDITIDDGGSGYSQYDTIKFGNTDSDDPLIHFRSAKAQVLEVDGSGAITKIRMLYSGKGYIKLPTLSISDSGTGAVLTPVGVDIGKIKKMSIINPGLKYTLSSNTVDIGNSGTNNLMLSYGTIFTNDGKFLNNDGFLSDKKFLIDSLYYQDYSYVLKIGLETKTYKDIVKRLVHPAGFQMFGEIATRTDLDVSLKNKIQAVILKIIAKLEVKTKHEYERWLKILSKKSVAMKLDSKHGKFLPTLLFPTSIKDSLRLIDTQIQSLTEVNTLLIRLVDRVDTYDDIIIDNWPQIDSTSWKIKYHNLVVWPTPEHGKQLILVGTVSGNEGDKFLTGSGGTTFTSDFSDNDYIIFGDKKMIVDSVGDDDTIFLTTPLCEDIVSESYLKEENLL